MKKTAKRMRVSFAQELRETCIGDFTYIPELNHDNFMAMLPAIERGLLVASKSEDRVTVSQLYPNGHACGYAAQVDGYRGKTWCSYWIGYDFKRDRYVARVNNWGEWDKQYC